MSAKKVFIFVVALAVIGVVIVVSASKVRRHGTKVYEEEARRVDALISTVKASGEIQPRVYVNISSQVPGEIVELRVEEGNRVRKGDILVQLDPAQYRSNVERLEADLRLARIKLEQEKTALDTYERTLKRQRALASKEIVSQEALDEAQLRYDRSRIEIRALKERIRRAEAELIKARDELSKTTLRAPMSGLVTKVNAKVGEQVIIGTMNNPGTVILVLSDMSELLAEVKVDETEVARVKPGQKATITVDAIEDRTFEGVVTEIAHSAIKERDVSRFIVKVALADTDDGEAAARRELPLPEEFLAAPGLSALRPGMSAHAAIQVAYKETALVVPIQAVIEKKRSEVEEALADETGEPDAPGPIAAEETAQEAGTTVPGGNPPLQDEMVEVVFVDRDGKAQLVPVRTGLSDEFNVEILDGELQPGDLVVVGPYRTLKKLDHGEPIVRAEKDEDLKEQD